MGVEGQSLTAEDELFILTQAGLYLTATRGFAAPEALICYERVESLCHLLNRPVLPFSALMGQWRYSLLTDKLTATMQIAERIHSLAEEQNDAALMIGAYRALAATLYLSGDFETARQYAMRGIQIWRSGNVQSPVEELHAPVVPCLYFLALCEWHMGEIASCRATMVEAISLAKELNDMHALAVALWHAGRLAHFEGNPTEVERLASDLIELSTRQNFALWSRDLKSTRGMPNCTGSAVCFSQLLVLKRRRLRPRSAQPSLPQRSRSRFHWRNALKQPTRNIGGKKRVRQEDVDSDYLFGGSRSSPHFDKLRSLSGIYRRALPSMPSEFN